MGIRGVKKPHPLDPAAAGVSQLLARGVGGVKRPHPLGSVPSRSGASQLLAESGVASVTLPGVKISALPAAGGATISDQLEANQSGTSRSITVAQVSAAVQSTLPPVDWSAITGKPSTFPPTVPIAYSNISGTPTSLPPSGPAGGDLQGSYPNPTLKAGVIPAPPTSLPPSGPASGDLNGSYPGPTIKPGTAGQVLTTVGGVSAWAAPTGGAPSGAAGGDLAGTYPAPTVKASVGLTGTPTAPTATPSTTSTTQIATTAFVQSALPTTLPGPPTGAAGGALAGTYPNPTLVGGPLSNYALTSSIPTTLPPNGAAGGGLAGIYPNPTIKPSTTNGDVLTTVAGAAAWAAPTGGSGGASVTVSDTAPGSPTAGALWWNSTLGVMFIWYVDPNTSQWVPVVPSGGNTPPNSIPQNAQTGNYTLVALDAGQHIYHAAAAAAATYTIPANSSVPFAIGTTVSFANDSANAVTIAITTDTLVWGTSTGSRTLAQGSLATALKVTATSWMLNGSGLT